MRIDPQGVYNLDEAGKLLRQSKWSVRKKLREGRIPGHRVGHEVLIFGSDLRDYIQRQDRQPSGGFVKSMSRT